MKNDLEKIANEVIEELMTYVRGEDEDGKTIEDYLKESIEFHIYGISIAYLGVCVTHSFGGPNIHVDTLRGCVEVYYEPDYLCYPLPVEIAEAIDEVCRELY